MVETMSTSQVKSDDATILNEPAPDTSLKLQVQQAKLEYYKSRARLTDLIVVLLTCAAAKVIGKRIEMFAEGGYLPGMADTRGLGALANRPESSIASVIGDNPRAKFCVGRQPFYRLSDFALFKEGDEPAEIPPTDAPVKRAGKKKS